MKLDNNSVRPSTSSWPLLPLCWCFSLLSIRLLCVSFPADDLIQAYTTSISQILHMFQNMYEHMFTQVEMNLMLQQNISIIIWRAEDLGSFVITEYFMK